jgi:3-hydroxyisobutyrate dehydrogenase-like beta-hydroxyacid dehydrogenase
MTAAVVGVGALGRGFVASLLRAGFEVQAHDTDLDALAHAAELGARPVPAADVDAEAIVLALPDRPDVEAALAAGLSPRSGSIVVLTSTVGPEAAVVLAERFAAVGAEFVDAPVSGGPARAEAGTLAIMVGASAEGLLRARPLLAALGDDVVHVGPVGHGQLAKLANNLMGAVTTLGIAEGLALAARGGADVQRVCEAIAGGSGSSWILREWIPETVLAGDYQRRFSVDLMRKDLRLIVAECARLGVSAPAAALARDTFDDAAASGHGDADFSIVAALAEPAFGGSPSTAQTKGAVRR